MGRDGRPDGRDSRAPGIERSRRDNDRNPFRNDREPPRGIHLNDRHDSARDFRPRHITPRDFARVNIGPERYFYNRGIFYRQGPHGYAVVRAPRHAVVRDLPYLSVYVVLGDVGYWRHGNVYYQPCPEGYMVIDPPGDEIPAMEIPGDYEQDGYEILDRGGEQFWFKDGQFFIDTGEGLVWVEVPFGALIRRLPEGARLTRYQAMEYFVLEDVVFQNTPEGYVVVAAPWGGDLP